MRTFELEPTDGRKSFYGKCRVIEEGGVSKLQSYSTIVAEYDHTTNEMKVNGYYSGTTMRHINSFLKLYGFDTCSKKQLEKTYL